MISAHMDEVGFQVIDKISDHKYKIKPLGKRHGMHFNRELNHFMHLE